MKKAFCFAVLLVGVIFLARTNAVADCPDAKVLCISIWMQPGDQKPFYYFYAGTCWNWGWLQCEYCQSLEDLASRCNKDQPSLCGYNACAACRTFTFWGAMEHFDPRGTCHDVQGNKYPNPTSWP